MRDGIDYGYWYSNVQRVLSETNSNVAIMTTINMLSLPRFCKFIEDIMELRIEFNKDLHTIVFH